MQCNVSQERAFLEKYENLEDFVSGGGKGDWREFTIVIQEEGRFWWRLRCGRHLVETLRFGHLSVGPVLDGVGVGDLRLVPLLLRLLLLLTHRAWHHHLFCERKLSNQRAVATLSLVKAVKVEEAFRATDKKPEASSDDCKRADVPAAKLVQMDRGEGTTLQKRFSDSGRQISRASSQRRVYITKPTIVLWRAAGKNLSLSCATFVQPEDMNGLSVAAAGEEGPAGGEGEGEDGGRSLQSAAQLVQLRSVVARENPDDRPLFTGSRNSVT